MSADASRVDVHRLTRILESLLFGRAVPQLPDWSYRTWYRVLQYPDRTRVHMRSRESWVVGATMFLAIQRYGP